jgi:hypothetical protein
MHLHEGDVHTIKCPPNKRVRLTDFICLLSGSGTITLTVGGVAFELAQTWNPTELVFGKDEDITFTLNGGIGNYIYFNQEVIN